MNLTESVVIYVDDSGSMWGRGHQVEAIINQYDNPTVFRVGPVVGPWEGDHVGAGKPSVKVLCDHAQAWGIGHKVFITDEHGCWTNDELARIGRAGLIMREVVAPPPSSQLAGYRYGTSTVMSVWGEKDEQFARERDNLSAFENLTPRQQVWITERVRLGIESFLKKEAFPGVVGAGTEMVPQGEIPYFEFTFRIYPDSTYPGGKRP